MPAASSETCSPASTIARARMVSSRGEPLLLADWDRAVFLHFEVDPALLQPHVTFPLDLRDGRAYVSLVAFTMRRMRFACAERLSEWLLRPIGTHPFLNVRTYVRYHNEPGIQFLAEWMTNRFSLHLGPLLFGLPYRRGCARYRHDFENGRAGGDITGSNGAAFGYRISCEGEAGHPLTFDTAGRDTMAEFLVERYTCFTAWRGLRRAFRVWHLPWHIAGASAEMPRTDLLESFGPWFGSARFIGAHISPGCRDVWMGRPHFLHTRIKNML